ncbi:hypothetical protein AeRB84_018561 [Aphanomyces euteiches]|nr:hypothetical protein AeRB84_018561 [Aphanomyces euteiches]
MQDLSLSGHSRYFLTFTDDFSRYGFVFFLKQKSDTLQCFKDFNAYCNTQFGQTVKCLRSDNGGEYISTSFAAYLHDNRIRHEKTVPHTPEQNGVSERMNRTLVECARAMLHFCNAPPRFWAEAETHAMCLRNRWYSSSTPGTTPFEKLWRKKPDLSNLKIFGCTAFAHIEQHARSKFAPKSLRTMYLGNEHDVKGFRLYCSNLEKIIASRNVIFDENTSYFKHEDSPASSLQVDSDENHPEVQQKPHATSLNSGDTFELRRSTRPRRVPSRFDGYVQP